MVKLLDAFENIQGIDKFFLILILLIPTSLVAGPFLPDLFVVILSLGFFYKALNINLKNYLFNKYGYFFLLFWLYISIRSLFTEDLFFSLKASFPYIRFFVYSLMILYFFEKYKNKFIYLLLLSIALPILFVCFDTLYQFFSGRDIFGYPKLEHRLSGPFGDELIVGAYLARLSPLLIILYFIIFKNFPLKIIILFSMISPLIFITGERTSFFLFNFFLVFFLLFSFKKNKLKIFFSIFSIIAFFLAITLLFNSKLRDRMIHIPACEMRILFLANDNCKGEYIEKQNISDKKIKNYYIFSAAHEGHFKTALNIFFDNKFFGSGVKMFRVKCADPKYYEEHGCTTHPHNLLMQILAETGLVGLLFLITAISYICTKSFKIILLIFLGKNKYFHIIQLLLLIMMLQSFFILLPSGQFFNNWNAIVIYSPLGIYLKYAYYT